MLASHCEDSPATAPGHPLAHTQSKGTARVGRTSARNRVRLATAAAVVGLVSFGAPGIAAAAGDSPVVGKTGAGNAVY